MLTSLAEAVCRLNVLLNLDNLSTRRLRKRGRTNKAAFLVLARLRYSHSGEMSQTDLAEYLQLVPSHVHKVTTALDEEGLVKRVPSTTRSHGVTIRLTKKGKDKVDGDTKSGAREFAVFDILWDNENDRKEAIRLLDTVLKKLTDQSTV